MKAVTREQVECRCLGEKTCKENREVKFLDGSSLPSIPYPGEGNYYQGKRIKNEHCHDCGCLQGKFHHPGCDMEICPRCKQQAIQCDCLNDWKALERQEKQAEREVIKLSRESDKQFRKTSKRWKREEREAEKRVLKQDVEHRRLHKEGYTLLCDGGPAPVDLSHLLIQKIIAKNCVQQNDVVLCSTTYDKDGKFIPDEVSLWAKIPKVVVRKSEKTFEFERMGYGMSRARWTVWYEGHADIKGCGLTKKEAVLDLEDRHEQVWLAKRYPLTRNTKWSFGSLKKLSSSSAWDMV